METILGVGVISGILYLSFLITLIALIPLYFIIKWAVQKAIVNKLTDPKFVKEVVRLSLISLAYYDKETDENGPKDIIKKIQGAGEFTLKE